MRLAYCIHSLYNSGGTERVLTEKANALVQDYGYEITIITAKQDGRPAFFPLDPAIRIVDLGINFYAKRRLPRYMKALESALTELRPDICISLSNYEIYGLADLKDGSIKVAEYHFNHNRWMDEKGSNPFSQLKARIRTRKIEKAAARMKKFVVLTMEDMEDWKATVPSVCQIYNPSPFDIQRSPLKNKSFIATGRLAHQKNFSALIDSWKIVNERHPDWTLNIYGRGPEKTMLESRIRKHGLEGKVILNDPVPDISLKMSESSGLLLSSIYEGLGMVLVEGATLGLPLISTRCKCGPSEIIEEGRNGYLLDNGDTTGFADRICRLIENPGLREEMGRRSLEISRRFSKKEIISQWDTLFRSLTD